MIIKNRKACQRRNMLMLTVLHCLIPTLAFAANLTGSVCGDLFWMVFIIVIGFPAVSAFFLLLFGKGDSGPSVLKSGFSSLLRAIFRPVPLVIIILFFIMYYSFSPKTVSECEQERRHCYSDVNREYSNSPFVQGVKQAGCDDDYERCMSHARN